MTTDNTKQRRERRQKKERPSYLDPDLLDRVAAAGEARLLDRARKIREAMS